LPRAHWTNIDSEPYEAVDVQVRVPPIPYADGSVAEIFAGHFLEHLDQDEGAEFLREAYRVLEPGGKLGVVVPDTREILRRWLAGVNTPVEFPLGTWWRTDDLDDVCAMFLYSSVQPSRHLWSYDLTTLTRAVQAAGFRVAGEIDRHYDRRLGSGAWYQFGIDALKE
jgi:hypothetical protein